jgi:hypothetical protein
MARNRLLTRGRHAALVGTLVALALVFAQTGALVHGCSHLRSSSQQLSAPGTTSQGCTDCLSFAPLLAAAHGHSHPFHVAAPVATPYRTLVPPLVGLSPRHAFLSRGPPLPA